MSRCLKIISVFLFVAILLFGAGLSVSAAPLSDIPQKITQPDGTVINCFASGDERFNYLHDEAGNLLMVNKDGYVVYAAADVERLPVPSSYLLNEENSNCPKVVLSDIDVKKAVEQSVFEKGTTSNQPTQIEVTEQGTNTAVGKTAIPLATDTQENTGENKTPTAEARTFTNGDSAKAVGQPNADNQCEKIKMTLAISLIAIIIGLLLFYFAKGKGKKLFSILLVFSIVTASVGFTLPAAAQGTGGISGTMKNLVVYICFSGESTAPFINSFGTNDSKFNGNSNSVKNYYETISGGRFTIDSVAAKQSENVYVYQDSHPKDYYRVKSVTNTIGYVKNNIQEQAVRERELLFGALTAVQDKFSGLSGSALDFNLDGFADSVTFVVNGGVEAWADLLWPHMWNFDGLNYYGDNSGYPLINGMRVNDFNFQLSDVMKTGVLCHELSHVLGAPDLYDYNYEYDFAGSWDLMAHTNDTPQYMLAYMREKYFGWTAAGQITHLSDSGSYTLSPVTPDTSGVTALCFDIGETSEKIYIEYRNKTAATQYDSGLSGTGLIVYRTRSDMDGN